jgi:hypothetical protein
VTESPLDKVLRLTGGITRSYVRAGPRGPVRVGQYANHRRVAWGNLKVGEIVQIAGIRYEVLQVHYKPKLTTGSGTSTGSKGKGVNTKGGATARKPPVPHVTGTPNQSPGKAAAAGQKAPAGAAKVINVLLELGTTRRYYVSLPAGQVMTVVG